MTFEERMKKCNEMWGVPQRIKTANCIQFVWNGGVCMNVYRNRLVLSSTRQGTLGVVWRNFWQEACVYRLRM